jgi:hypothetical protein
MEGKMDGTFSWFAKADFKKYEGKYISIVGKKVVCANDNPEVAYNLARKKHPKKEVVLWKVMEGEMKLRVDPAWSGSLGV